MEEKRKIREWIRQIGYIRLGLLVVCVIFLLLVSLPEEKKTGENVKENETKILDTDENDIYVEKMEERLASILEMMEGAGNVEVMITLSSSSETIVNKDTSYENARESETGDGQRETDSSGQKEETILIDHDGNQVPYVIKTMEPIVEGVIVVMEGGDNSYVSAAVTEAVQALFHVDAHKIKVLKMEDEL